MTHAIEFLLRLWLTDRVGAGFVQKVFAANQNANLELSAETFLQSTPEQLSALLAISVKEIAAVQQRLASPAVLEHELEAIEKCRAKIMTIFDPEYPESLRQIYAPPAVLLVQGQLPKTWQTSIAIVGSRHASKYADTSLDFLIPELVAHGFVTVSGGATGVDTMAHQKTLELGGKTVAVLGSGLANIYPKENAKLFAKIVDQGGAVISPFNTLMAPLKGNFPARNRIVSGLTPACLVVQAARKSGALITASFALEQNREVLTIPGPITDPMFEGNNQLLKQGAGVVTQTADIFNALGFENYFENCKPSKLALQQTCLLADEPPIFQFLQQPIGAEELAHKTGIEFALLQEMLFDLQLEAKVQQNFNGTWIKV